MNFKAYTGLAAVIVSLGLLTGCPAANSGAVEGGTPTTKNTATLDPDDGVENMNLVGLGQNTATWFPNAGETRGVVGLAPSLLYQLPSPGFVCRESYVNDTGATMTISANGLVGAVLGPLLNLLGGNSVTNLLNSLIDADLGMDADLKTAAKLTQTLSGLGGILNSVDVVVSMPEGDVMEAGNFAVFAVSFPPSLLELGLLSTLRVQTLLNGELVENGAMMDGTSLSLLGLSSNELRGMHTWIGFETAQPFDQVRLRVSSNLLSVDLGESLYVHEVCSQGEWLPGAEPETGV